MLIFADFAKNYQGSYFGNSIDVILYFFNVGLLLISELVFQIKALLGYEFKSQYIFKTHSEFRYPFSVSMGIEKIIP